VVHTSEGHIVRAFHHFTLVDQSGRGRDITKGRRREQGAVKISCARQDPNARNCHGYRKFIKRTLLENPESGYLLNDTIKIKYKIELVVMSGGAFCRNDEDAALPTVDIPDPRLSEDMGILLKTGEGSDFVFVVEGEEMPAHRLIVASRSPVFKALLGNDMREGVESKINIYDVRAPAFQILLHFVYTDSLPQELSGENLEVTMAQHLLAAADRFELPRLRAICEKHLCETVDIANAATTLTLAEENHATELKRHCLEFVAQNLSSVMNTSGFDYMIQRCPDLQRSILETTARSKDSRGLPSPGENGSSKRDWEPGSSSKSERRVRFRLSK
jgi:speckle-type POZ protein